MIGVTLGDPAGIGPSVSLAAIQRFLSEKPTDLVVFGASNQLRPFGDLPVTLCPVPAFDGPPGKPTRESGECALAYLREAVSWARTGRITALATAPISKTALALAGSDYRGHTEFFKDCFDVDAVAMSFVSSKLRVALVTTHIPLREVVDALAPKRIEEVVRLFRTFLREQLDIASPKLALAGLNPHAGEGGLLGSEDREILAPVVRTLSAQGVGLSGPWPADTVFRRAIAGEFDGVVALYHDQGLIPVKLMDDSVQVTLGLPIVRTSVDHGTAYDLVGTDKADCGPMQRAIEWAYVLAN